MFAHGSTFKIGATLVGKLNSISLPDRSRDESENTSHDSGGDRTYEPGLRDGGSVTLEGRLAPGDAGVLAIESNYSGDAAETCVIELPDIITPSTGNGTRYSFSGFVTAINGDLPFDDQGSFSVTLKVSGAVTITAAS
jgi:hypothetical protein